MIDFHAHILPNIDDGSKSVEETFNLIKEAKKAGFNGIVSTSHYFEGYYEVVETERKKLIDAIMNGLTKQEIDLEIYLGSEIYFSDNICDLLENGKACAINNTNYILFELPHNSKPINLYDVIYNIQQHRFVPILAHPERYSFIHEDPSIVKKLIEKGVLMQSNYGSIIGQYGEKAQIIVIQLLKKHMVHFLGTDVHTQKSIYPKMRKILREIKGIVGKKYLETISTINPELALSNQIINIEEPKEIELSGKEKRIMKSK